MKERYCKSAQDLKMSDLDTSNPKFRKFVEGITPQELLVELRYFHTMHENPNDVVFCLMECYDFEYGALDGDLFSLCDIKMDLINAFDKLNALGYIRDCNDFYYTAKIINLLSPLDFDEYLLMEDEQYSRSHYIQIMERNERYETTKRISQKDVDAILRVFRRELPPMQYMMVEYVMNSDHCYDMELHEAERAMLNLACKNIKSCLPLYVDELIATIMR